MTHTKLLCDGSSGDARLEYELATVMLEAFKLWKARHLKYGRLNISMFGEVGCVVRSGDKVARLAEFYLHGKHQASDESIEDSWFDLMNYAGIGLLCKRGVWEAPSNSNPSGSADGLR